MTDQQPPETPTPEPSQPEPESLDALPPTTPLSDSASQDELPPLPPEEAPPDGTFPVEDYPPEPPRPAWLARLSNRRVMILIAGLSAVFLLAAIGLGSYVAKNLFPAGPTPTATLPPFVPPESLSALATQYPELAPLLMDGELDSAYKDFVLAYQQGGVDAALDLARKRGILSDDDQIRVTLELDTTDSAELVTQLEELGIVVLTVSDNLIDIGIPLALIDEAMQSDDPTKLFADITGLDHVIRLRLPMRNIPEGNVQPAEESNPVIGADTWHSAGFTGRGIKVGVLDMGFNGYKNLLGTELPANVTVQSFISGHEADDSDTEHGAAVGEIIYDIAPDAELYFAAYWTLTEQRRAVDWLVSQGVQIISHSAGSNYGPMDGSSDQARMVDGVVQGGIFWANSAGNNGESHYRGTFTDDDGDGYHEFSPGDELMGMRPDMYASMTLNWDDWSSGSEDYDLFILDDNMDKIVSSENLQDGGDDAAEWIEYYFGDDNVYYVAILAARTTRSAVLDFYVHNAEIEYFNANNSLGTPGDSFQAFTVGATYWADDSLESYSSQGPTNDGRLKPEISAPAGVYSVAYGDSFYGTSASTPHVAGAAALVLQAYPNFTVDDMKAYLENQAVDLGPSGADYGFGYGRLWLGAPPGQTTPPDTGLPPTQPPVEPGPQPTLPPTRTPFVSAPPSAPVVPPSGGSAGTILLLALTCLCCLAGLGLAGLLLVVIIAVAARPKPRPRMPYPPRYPPQQRPPYPPQQYQQQRPQYPPQQARPPAPPQQQAAMPRCPRCGAPHRPEARFCPACGQPFTPPPPQQPPAAPYQQPQPQAVPCRYCGRPIHPASRACPYCGKPR